MDTIPVKGPGDQLLSAEYNNAPQEAMNFVTDTGQTLSGLDLHQTSKAAAIYAAVGDFYTDSGAADAYVLNLVTPRQGPIIYANGMRIRFIPGNVNTGASTVNVNSLGIKNFKDVDGSDLIAGEIEANGFVEAYYDGTNFVLIQSSSFTLPFSDALALIRNEGDPTKLIRFSGANITAGNERLITGADKDIDMAPASQAQAIAGTVDDQYLTPKSLHDASVVILQRVSVFDGAFNSGTTVIPSDNTIPVITEGDEYMTLAITPIRTDSKLKIDVVIFCATETTTMAATIALFQDAVVNSLAAVGQELNGTADTATVSFSFEKTSTTTSAQTYRIRAGKDAGGGTFNFNGKGGTALYGGVSASSIIITEYI